MRERGEGGKDTQSTECGKRLDRIATKDRECTLENSVYQSKIVNGT